jgi:hypothetical protein
MTGLVAVVRDTRGPDRCRRGVASAKRQGQLQEASQTMPKCHRDHGGVTMAVPIVSGRLHEPFDLALSEVLASAILGIRQPARRHCSLYSAWSAAAQS